VIFFLKSKQYLNYAKRSTVPMMTLSHVNYTDSVPLCICRTVWFLVLENTGCILIYCLVCNICSYMTSVVGIVVVLLVTHNTASSLWYTVHDISYFGY